MGTPRSRTTATATPPLAVPSSLVTTRPVTPPALANSRPWLSAFEPRVASSTSSVSCGAPSTSRPATRAILASSAIRFPLVCRRPAVSTSTASYPRLRAPRPDLELLGGGGAEGVGGADERRAPFRLPHPRELADRRRLPDAVHA